MAINFEVISLLPEIVESGLKEGVVGRALQNGAMTLKTRNPRQFTNDIHHTVDDRPYGGGDGMVMLAQPLVDSLKSLREERNNSKDYVIYLSPRGRVLNDQRARAFAKKGETLVLVCGRYGGIDQRFINSYVDEEVSIGDYVLSGGELAAAVFIDCVTRLCDDVLGNKDSKDSDSFAQGLLEAPLFTRPAETLGQRVPEFLSSGDHQRIDKTRWAVALAQTLVRRPELHPTTDAKEVKKALDILSDCSEEELSTLALNVQDLQILREQWL